MVFSTVDHLVMKKENMALCLEPLKVLELVLVMDSGSEEMWAISMGSVMVRLKENMKVHPLENHLVLKKDTLMAFYLEVS